MRVAGNARGARAPTRYATSAAKASALLAVVAGAALLAIGPPAAAAPGRPAGAASGISAEGAPIVSTEGARVERVLVLENQRLGLMSAVAAWKWTHHAAVTDAARERAIIADTARLARQLGLEAGPVERLFELQMQLARHVEEERLDEWRRRGFRYAGRIPDLSREVRPELDRLTSALLHALSRAAPAFVRPGFASRYEAAAARDLSTAGWTPQSRRALLDSLQRIRLAPARR